MIDEPGRGAHDVVGVDRERNVPAALAHRQADRKTQVEGLDTRVATAVAATVLAGVFAQQAVAKESIASATFDVTAAHARGITICNTPGVLDDTTADLAFLLILSASRLAHLAEADLRSGAWHGWGINQYLGRDVHGATLGLVGYGRIGRAVARRATGFGMSVLHHTRTDSGEVGWVGDLHRLLGQVDIVSLHVPLNDATRHLIGAAELAAMKPTAVLVNTARGPVVDEVALAAALTSGTIFAAGVDVFEQEPSVHPALLAAPRTVLLPHIGSASVATRTRMAQVACAGVASVLAGQTPQNVV